MVAVTALGTWGTSSCLLRVRLRVALKPYRERLSPRGTIQRVEGNPAAKALRVVLRPGGLLVYSWRWRNWCGHKGRFVLQPAWGRYAFWPSLGVRPPTCRCGRIAALPAPPRQDQVHGAGTEWRHLDAFEPDSGESGEQDDWGDAHGRPRTRCLLGMGELVRRRRSLSRFCRGCRAVSGWAGTDAGGDLRRLRRTVDSLAELRHL